VSGIITTHGHVRRAYEFYNRSNIYVGIGRTTPWVDENIPPIPTGDETAVVEIFGYKNLHSKMYVVPDPEGELSYRGQGWREVQPENIYDEGAKWVLVKFFLEFDELPLIGYRQIGIYTGLEKLPGVSDGPLVPEQVVNPGILEVIDNKKVESREVDKKEEITLIIEF